MKQSSISAFLVLCSVVLNVSVGFGENDTEINWIHYPIYTDCGGVIPLYWNDGGASARIEYKLGTTFSPNEFCVWTFIAEDTAVKIELYFETPIPAGNDGLVLYTWKDFNFTSHKIPGPDTFTLTIDAQHFAVAFSSDWSAGSNGFRFYVYIKKFVEGATSPKGYFSAQNKGEFTYPSVIGQENYDGDQRVSIVMHGPTETIRQTREYSLRDLDTEKNHDFVEVYILQPYNFDSLYKFIGRFSGQKSGAVAKSSVMTPFPVLYLFSSDKKVTGKGFTVTWKLVGNGIENTWDSLICN